MFTSVLPTRVSVEHMCLYRGRKSVSDPLELELQVGCALLREYRKSNSSHRQEQQVLLSM